MTADSQLKDTLLITVNNAVSRMGKLRDAEDRRCLFNEYKEWLRKDENTDVWAIPTDWNRKGLDALEDLK